MADTLEEITSRLLDFIREEGQEATRARSDVGPVAPDALGQSRVDVGMRGPVPLEGEQSRKHHEMMEAYGACLRKVTADERAALASVIRELSAALEAMPRW